MDGHVSEWTAKNLKENGLTTKKTFILGGWNNNIIEIWMIHDTPISILWPSTIQNESGRTKRPALNTLEKETIFYFWTIFDVHDVIFLTSIFVYSTSIHIPMHASTTPTIINKKLRKNTKSRIMASEHESWSNFKHILKYKNRYFFVIWKNGSWFLGIWVWTHK